jgi:hypothetical protein
MHDTPDSQNDATEPSSRLEAEHEPTAMEASRLCPPHAGGKSSMLAAPFHEVVLVQSIVRSRVLLTDRSRKHGQAR